MTAKCVWPLLCVVRGSKTSLGAARQTPRSDTFAPNNAVRLNPATADEPTATPTAPIRPVPTPAALDVPDADATLSKVAGLYPRATPAPAALAAPSTVLAPAPSASPVPEAEPIEPVDATASAAPVPVAEPTPDTTA